MKEQLKLKKEQLNSLSSKLVMLNMYPADKLAKACVEKTKTSLNPWALNFSSSL